MLRTILSHELRYYFKSKSEAINLYGIFVIISLVYIFSGSASSIHYQEIAAGICWTGLSVAIAIGAGSLFQRDYDNGLLEHYCSANSGLMPIILAKWMAYYLFITVPLLSFLPVIALLVDIPVDAWCRYGLGLAAGSMALSLLAALISVVTTGLDKVGALVSLVVMPLYIPIIIFGVSYLNSTGSLIQPQLYFLMGMSLCLFPILCLAGASCIRASN